MDQFKKTLKKGILLFIMFLVSYTAPVFSCSTPVFRYALEMWAAYAYSVEVVHYGNLTNSQQQALDYLKNASSSEVPVNIKVNETVINHSDDNEKEILPMVKLSFPEALKIPGVVWQGALTIENAKKIIDSPSRRQVVENIRKGDAAVWLFLESGNTEKDSRQLQVLKEELQQLSENLKLSETATDVAGNLLDIKVINTGVSFSFVRLNRNDPAEEIFIQMLLATEADLKLFKNAPLAFPVFGQGRTLYALVGNGIKSKNIETACSSIIGWCSCTIKDDNPGTDLLLKADWNIAIGDSSWIQKEEIPDITGLYDFVSIEEGTGENPEIEVEKIIIEETVEDPEHETIDDKEKEELIEENKNPSSSKVIVDEEESYLNPLWRNSLYVLVLLLFVIVVVSFILKRK